MILGIESSCDESALALFDPGEGIVGDWVHSQIKLHSKYGGIVPDLASREHLKQFPPLLEILRKEHDVSRISQIAVTSGPGLAACLALGVAFAKSLAVSWSLPYCGVNHLKAHAFSPFIQLHKSDPGGFSESFEKQLPHLGLIVSGGNTLLFEMGADKQIHILAQTVDDAAGEALDKGAKLLGMEYPGGPLIEKKAEGGDPRRFEFPRAFASKSEMKFSFSGLKTSLRYRLEAMSDVEINSSMPDLCASYQEAVVDALSRKTRQAINVGAYASLGLSGGVSNNRRLRSAFEKLSSDCELPLHIAEPVYTGDNAAMIAFTAWLDKENTLSLPEYKLNIDPSMVLS